MSKIRSRDCHVWLRGLSKLISKFNADTSQDDALTQSGGQIVPWRCSTLRTSKSQNTVARMEYRIWNICTTNTYCLVLPKTTLLNKQLLRFIVWRLSFYFNFFFWCFSFHLWSSMWLAYDFIVNHISVSTSYCILIVRSNLFKAIDYSIELTSDTVHLLNYWHSLLFIKMFM